MSWEILEAICEYYKGDDESSIELIKDCLMYLKEINKNDEKLNSQINEILTDMKYCSKCGNKFEQYINEGLNELYCLYCDVERK